MNYLLDACLISELVKPRPDANVLRWIEAAEEHRLFLSVVTLGELTKGIAKLPDSPRKTGLREWLEHDLVEQFAGRILPVDAVVATLWGRTQREAGQAGVNLPVITYC